jgi:hypothetical protein
VFSVAATYKTSIKCELLSAWEKLDFIKDRDASVQFLDCE